MQFQWPVVLLSLSLIAGCGGTPSDTDAGPTPDAATLDASTCSTASECDDGLVCNGVERCSQGRCVAGVAMQCDDGIACTIDRCSETTRACTASAPDADGDGSADASCVDGTGVPLGVDCDDHDANRFPTNREVCDAAMHDEDCSATTHGATDADGDGFEDARCCNGTDCGDDCDDARATSHPGATEVCNGVDDDCNGQRDEGVAVAGFVDADRDGYGDDAMPSTACESAVGFSALGHDCDDHDVTRNPGQAELCDTVDNDCDTIVDESASAVTWFRDVDGDGFGSPRSGTTSSCSFPAGYSLLGTDCDDASIARSPATAELCNGIDDDCNGAADYAIAPGDTEDDDLDGVADAHCGLPRGLDCDDRDAASTPGQPETCDGRDNDCDTRIDEGATSVAFYRDVDGDGFGSAAVMIGCSPSTGFVRRGGDCDDANAQRHPGTPEACNASDDDCDGAVDEGDAFATCGMPHTLVACVSGECRQLGCAAGYADCVTQVPGCDTDLRSSASDCGACGRACIGSLACVSGGCSGSPASCAELRSVDPTAVDGDHTLYYGGNVARPFTAYCHHMASTPLTFLTLTQLNTSDYDTTGFVFSGETTCTTTWTRVRFDATQSAIVPNDFTFSSSVGFVPHSGEPTSEVAFAVARDCSGDHPPHGHAIVDLRGLPFAVVPNWGAAQGAGPESIITPGNFFQTVDIVAGGFCGWAAPGGDRFGGVPLPLIWCPAPGPENCSNGLDDDCDGTVDDC